MSDPRSNGTVWIPAGAVPEIRTKEEIDLAKIPLVSIDVKDFGNHSEAIGGLMQRLQLAQSNMFSGYHRSPRTGQESKFGSRADAEEHTDTDTGDVELIDGEMCDAFNQQVVDDLLVVNFGERARGAVFFVPGKLRDEHLTIDHKLIDGVLNNPETSTSFHEQVDYDAVAVRRGIPKRDGKPIVVKAVLSDDGDEDPPTDEQETPKNAE
jgi:hypothetical protein